MRLRQGSSKCTTPADGMPALPQAKERDVEGGEKKRELDKVGLGTNTKS